MRLSITIEQPEKSRWNAWLALGAEDLTRLDPEHERALVLDLGRQGAQIVWVEDGETPVLRFLLHPLQADEGVGSLGFFAWPDTVSNEVLQAAFTQALQQIQGFRRLIGPMNGSTWFAYRLRTDPHPLQFDWEPPAQPRLQALLEQAGFAPIAHYRSTATEGLQKLKDSIYKDWKRVVERGFSLRPITGKELQGGALLELHRLSQIGFADNPLFVPLSFEAFASRYLQGKSTKDNYLFAAYEPLGRCVAFFLAFLEPSPEGGPKTLVFKTIATDPGYRRQGLSNALCYAICQELPTSVQDCYISALVFQGGASESFARHGTPLWEHTYLLFGKDLR